MKKLLLIPFISILSLSAQAQTLRAVSTNYGQSVGQIANTSGAYAGQSGLDAMLNGATSALSRAGNATTSAASAIARSNLAKQALLGGATAGVVGAVAGVAIGALIDYGSGKISSNADGTLNLTNKQATVTNAGAFAPGQMVWTLANAGTYTGKVFSTSVGSLIPLYIEAQNKNISSTTQAHYYLTQLNNCAVSGTQYYCQQKVFADGYIYNGSSYVAYQTTATTSCATGFVYNGSSCIADPSATLGEQTQIVQMNDLISKLTQTDLNSKVSATDLSNLTNALLSAGNQAGLQNVPMTNAQDFANANVKLSDLVSPITTANVQATANTPLSATTTSPATSPSTTTSTTTTTDPSTGATTSTTNVSVNVNFGPDPGIQAPILEATPSTNQILDPIFNMMPKTFTISGNQGSCPSPTFSVLQHTYNFDFMCNILNTHAGLISAIMLFAFTVASVVIILSA